jgi:small ligand-binding sensory domain FIST
VDDVIQRASAPLGGERADLAIFFATNHFEDEFARAAEAIRDRVRPAVIIGCTGEGIIGTEGEIEREPGMSLWLASMPGVEIQDFHVDQARFEEVDTVAAFHELVGVKPTRGLSFIVLADPFSFHIVNFLNAINECYRHVPVVGGLASGVEGPGQTRLAFIDDCYDDGAVGVALSGNIQVDTIVSQGCRPIGRPFVITAAEQNIIKLLGGKPAMTQLNEVFTRANEQEKKLMQQGIFVGQVINEYKDAFGRGDFLIRNMVGADQRTGALMIGDEARVGRTIQFQVRDAKTAEEDLRMLLAAHRESPPVGALMFNCNGRGTRLFDQPNHDLAAVRSAVGPVPVAGFFCAGEFGPVGEKNFIHGHTASIALFSPRQMADDEADKPPSE